MECEENSYLNPPPLTEQQLKGIYGPNSESERREPIAGRTAMQSIRKLAKKRKTFAEL